jgi:hypothetical protein
MSPGFISTEVTEEIANLQVRAEIMGACPTFAISPDANRPRHRLRDRAPSDIDVNEIVVRPTAQG